MRSARIFCLHLLVLLAVGAARAQDIDVPSSPDGDEVNRYAVANLGVVVPLGEKVDLNLGGAYAGGDAVIKVLLIDAPVRVNRYLTLTPGYFGLFLPRANGRRDHDQRARVSATGRLSFKGLSFSDRNMFERRFRTSRDSTRYRNLIRVERPVSIKGFDFTPFAYDEAFYDFAARAWTRNHVAVGVRKTLAKRYTGDLYYQHESAQNTTNNRLVFVALTVRLDRVRLFR